MQVQPFDGKGWLRIVASSGRPLGAEAVAKVVPNKRGGTIARVTVISHIGSVLAQANDCFRASRRSRGMTDMVKVFGVRRETGKE